MKIYQNSTFTREDNKITCTIDCKYVPFFCGRPMEEKAIEFKVSDYSKCHPDDTFDETYGQRLAETRASIKVYKKVKTILEENAKRICLEVDEVNQDFRKIEYLIADTEQHKYRVRE